MLPDLDSNLQQPIQSQAWLELCWRRPTTTCATTFGCGSAGIRGDLLTSSPEQNPVNGDRKGPTGVYGTTDPITTNQKAAGSSPAERAPKNPANERVVRLLSFFFRHALHVLKVVGLHILPLSVDGPRYDALLKLLTWRRCAGSSPGCPEPLGWDAPREPKEPVSGGALRAAPGKAGRRTLRAAGGIRGASVGGPRFASASRFFGLALCAFNPSLLSRLRRVCRTASRTSDTSWPSRARKLSWGRFVNPILHVHALQANAVAFASPRLTP